jgi:hypothetical protein
VTILAEPEDITLIRVACAETGRSISDVIAQYAAAILEAERAEQAEQTVP